MSTTESDAPVCSAHESSALRLVIQPKTKDLGGFTVRRVFPIAEMRSLGPFVFFDHMGPADFAEGQGIDVRPHPHINLATVTYLFEGEIGHKDSLGTSQVIRPGEINWMTAGRGITHSERTPLETRKHAHRVHGIQLWVALPKEYEETDPAFFHHGADRFPPTHVDGVLLRVLLGEAYGQRSPVHIFSRSFYVDVEMPSGTSLPAPENYEERAVYLAEGELQCGASTIAAPAMLVLEENQPWTLQATKKSRLIVLGGDRLDGPRHIWWNFVSSSKERIEKAKDDWKSSRFPKVPGDDKEFIPLPEA